MSEIEKIGDNAKMREALLEARRFVFAAKQGQRDILVNKNSDPHVIKAKDALAKIDAALAAPPRNCDVGSVETAKGRKIANYAGRKCPTKARLPMAANDMMAVRKVYEWAEKNLRDYGCDWKLHNQLCDMFRAALKSHPATATWALDRHAGKWLNGDNYEYEFAYCSECGHMQWAGWDSHSDACESISDFHKDYKFCPNCGASMIEGVYINGKGKNHGSK